MIKEFLKDPSGNFSHSRLIAVLVGFSATIFMWKMVLMGSVNEYYFGFYLLYGTGHQTINKFLDVIAYKFGKKNDIPTTTP